MKFFFDGTAKLILRVKGILALFGILGPHMLRHGLSSPAEKKKRMFLFEF